MVTKLRLCNELDQSGLKSTEIDKSLKFTTYDALGISVCGGYLATLGWSIPVQTCLNPYIDSLSHSFRQIQKKSPYPWGSLFFHQGWKVWITVLWQTL